MKRHIAAVAACALLLAGCDVGSETAASSGTDSITVWHDGKRSVTCWIFKGYQKGGISCIPDSQLPDPDSCMPGTETPGTKIDGKWFPGDCVSRRFAEGAR